MQYYPKGKDMPFEEFSSFWRITNIIYHLLRQLKISIGHLLFWKLSLSINGTNLQLLKFIFKLLLMVNINSLSVSHEYQETLKVSDLQSLNFLIPKLREHPSWEWHWVKDGEGWFTWAFILSLELLEKSDFSFIRALQTNPLLQADQEKQHS